MMLYTDITGLAGIAFAIVTLALRLPVVTRLQFKLKLLLAGALLIAVTLPLGVLSLVESVRGVSGDLSITTLLLLVVVLTQPRKVASDNRSGLLVLVSIGALALYPFALGAGMFDTYRLGFGDLWLVAGLLLIAVLAWLRRFTLVALSISLAVLAWSAGWYESGNLWDYLIDPWVTIYAIAALLKLLVSRIRRSI